jgi:hypothetical protein
MPYSKNYFEQFKEEIVKEHKDYETHLEMTTLPSHHCDHKGKVKAIPGGATCTNCHAGWQGPQINQLLDHFNVL